MVKSKLTIILALTLVLILGGQALAAPITSQPKGLLISPATDFISVNAEASTTENLLLANYTDKPINVTLGVKQFNVNNYSYSYTFNNARSNWINLSQNELNLAPNTNMSVPYVIKVPKGAKAGGYYLTLIASSVLGSGSIKSTAQAASLLYLTVNGKLSRTSVLKNYGLEHLSFSRQINYHFNVIDTGNVYTFIYTSAKLNGLVGASSTTPTANLIMPEKIRNISGAVTMPVWPGIYRVNYGYSTPGSAYHQETESVLYLPPWFIAIILAALLVLNITYGKRKNRQKVKHKTNHS